MIKKVSVLTIVFCVMLLWASSLYAVNADDVLGLWLTSKEANATKIEIVKCGDKFCGKIAWLEDPETLDSQNPDESKKSRKLVGLNMIYDFVFDDDEWIDGFIYNPEDGKTYDCKMWMDNMEVLNVKGTVGPKWLGIGKTVTWFKAK